MPRFRSIAWPKPSSGTKVVGVSMTLPDQSMSLATILDKFVRNEPLDVHMHGEASRFANVDDFDNPLNIDYEKLQHADLVEKAEFSDYLSSVKAKFDAEEKSRVAAQEAAKRRAEVDEIAAKIRAEESAKGSSEKSAQ